MTEIEFREISHRLHKLEQNKTNDFLLGIYTDLVRQHIDLLKDIVHNRFSSEDYENQLRLEKDVKILERSLDKLNELVGYDRYNHIHSDEEGVTIPIAH